MKDVAESVLARLLNIARANDLVYNELLMRYILERIFYRVGKSRHSGKFILRRYAPILLTLEFCGAQLLYNNPPAMGA